LFKEYQNERGHMNLIGKKNMVCQVHAPIKKNGVNLYTSFMEKKGQPKKKKEGLFCSFQTNVLQLWKTNRCFLSENG